MEAGKTQLPATMVETAHNDQVAMLNKVVNHLMNLYERSGNFQDLGAAIDHAEEVVKAAPDDHPGRALQLNNLGKLLYSRYERTGNVEDLEAAIHNAETAVKTTPGDCSAHVIWWHNLSNYLSSRYQQTGRPGGCHQSCRQSAEGNIRGSPRPRRVLAHPRCPFEQPI